MKKILFNDKFGLTQAVLDGRKTMTRRICKYDRPNEDYDIVFPVFEPNDYDNDGNITSPLNYAFGWKNKEGDFTGWNIPKYKVGEVVAIAQSYKDLGYHAIGLDRSPKDYRIVRGTLGQSKGWNNKMFVRSEACKHHIRITNVKIERLQDISDDECFREGIRKWTKDEELFKYDLSDGFEMFKWQDKPRTPREAFAALIDKVSGKGTWNNNPYVFAYEFQLID